MSTAEILVASGGALAQIRVVGRATYTCGESVREFGMRMLDSGIKRFLVDLSDCITMDSTFMGVLAMVAIRGQSASAEVVIVNAPEKAERLLAGLGLKYLFGFSTTETHDGTWESLCGATPSTDRDTGKLQRTMLEAHETLGQVDPANIPKFKDVVEFLRNDLQDPAD